VYAVATHAATAPEQDELVTTMRCDVLVLGSTLGGLVAATYIARSGLRVVLIEEDVHAKRPPLLREPFLLSGLESDGWVRRILRELALPLREQQSIQSQRPALQVVLPDARVDVVPDIEALTRELDAYQICDESSALPWLRAHSERANEIRAALWNDGSAKRVRTGSLPMAPSPKAGHFCAAIFASSRPLGAPPTLTEGSLLLRAALQAEFRMPDAGTHFLDLFRRRFQSLHGEILSAGTFSLERTRDGFQIDLERDSFHAQALVVAVPRSLLPKALTSPDNLPAELRSGAPPRHNPSRLFRVDASCLPPGMGDRTIVAGGPPEAVHWYAHSPDPKDPSVVWLRIHGPGARSVSEQQPFGDLCPFPLRGVVPSDPGPEPNWDVDAADLRFGPGPRSWPRSRLPICFVGPEASASLGFEGEILLARHRAQTLARPLAQRRSAVAFNRAI